MSKTATAFFLGLFAIIVGSAYLFVLPRFSQHAEARVRSLEPQSAASLRTGGEGRTVLIEGKISTQNESRYRNLVAYRRTSPLPGASQQTRWIEDDRVAPPLLIDVPDGTVRIDADYVLQNTTTGWQTKNYHYDGFTFGEQVIAVGTVTANGTVDASFVAGGTRQSYMWKRLGETWSSYIGGFCSIVLGLLMVVGSLMIWRSRARAAQP